jgi:hypothetical protein
MGDPNPEAFPAPPPPARPEPPPFHAPPPPAAPEAPAPKPTYLRIPAIVLFVVGLLILLGGVAKFVPGGLGSGGALCFWGALLFGLSFVPLPRTVKDSVPLSVLERITGLFYEPSRVFKSLGDHPRWLVAFLIISLLNIGYAVAFRQRLTPERIVAYVTDKMAQTPFIPPEAVEQAKVDQLDELTNPVRQIGSAIKSMVGTFAYFAFIAALLFLGVLVFGGRINYWQSLVVAIHAALPIVIIQRVLSFVLLYLKSPDEIHPILGQETLVQDNLGVLFSPAEHPLLFVLAASFGLLAFYALWLRATGLRNAGEKVSKAAAWSTAIVLWVLGLALTLVFTALFPAFIS